MRGANERARQVNCVYFFLSDVDSAKILSDAARHSSYGDTSRKFSLFSLLLMAKKLVDYTEIQPF